MNKIKCNANEYSKIKYVMEKKKSFRNSADLTKIIMFYSIIIVSLFINIETF
ncbi:MAG: hypothetical protein HY951_01105 [Bacteroidia bacterium]|nr:hypothetical protein [Bacteroidia bacterium]